MTRPFRLVLNGAAAISALLSLLLAGFWGTSYRTTYSVPFTRHGSLWAATCKNGELAASNEPQRSLEALEIEKKALRVFPVWNSAQQNFSRLIEARMRELAREPDDGQATRVLSEAKSVGRDMDESLGVHRWDPGGDEHGLSVLDEVNRATKRASDQLGGLNAMANGLRLAQARLAKTPATSHSLHCAVPIFIFALVPSWRLLLVVRQIRQVRTRRARAFARHAATTCVPRQTSVPNAARRRVRGRKQAPG